MPNDPPLKDRLRYRLVLGKFQVCQIDKGKEGIRITLDLGNSVKATTVAPPRADVRLGDLLTFYTEVLVDADVGSTSLQ